MCERCTCRACPACCPEVAAAAEATGQPFLKVLAMATTVQNAMLERLVKLHAPPETRADRRRKDRELAKIRAKRDRVRERRRPGDHTTKAAR